MKKLLLIILLLLALMITPSVVFAQGMMGGWTSLPSGAGSNNHTAQEEAEGKAIWDKLQSHQLTCNDLTDENFQALGEYFMGQSIDNTERHAAINQMMTNMMGENGEEQIHLTLGKRSSGCDTNTPLPSGYNLMPMMWWMMGGGGNPMMGYGGWNNMMGGWGGFGVFGWLIMLLFWALLILGVIALIRYLARSGQDKEGKTHLDILKERYAKGEINKKEFEETRKDLI